MRSNSERQDKSSSARQVSTDHFCSENVNVFLTNCFTGFPSTVAGE
jgi:hypothetical protein